ncbi:MULTISPECIES: hypothetical protein [unclassified Microcystis]|nr:MULTISPECIES: hypothetical protein [unclassified Microcystis]
MNYELGGGVVGNLAEISPSPYLPKSLSTVFRLSSQKKAILYLI